MTRSREKLGLLLAFFGMCLFAGTLPATRLAVTGLDPLFLTVARVTLAGCAALVVLLITVRPLPPRKLWGDMLAAASCTVLGFPLLAAFAMMTVPAAHGGVVFGILPLATTACATIFTHERPTAGFWLASVAGAAIVLGFVLRRSGSESFSIGDIFLLGTIAAGAVGYTLSGRLAGVMPGWEVISWQVVIYLVPAAIATVLLWPRDIGDVPLACWGALAYVGLVSQYTSFFVFNAAMAMAGIARAGQIMLLQPFMIVALASPVNGEPISLETLLFAAAVVATVVVAQRMRVKRAL
jgi:drug/metabolite transporter (DMT)-like permease